MAPATGRSWLGTVLLCAAACGGGSPPEPKAPVQGQISPPPKAQLEAPTAPAKSSSLPSATAEKDKTGAASVAPAGATPPATHQTPEPEPAAVPIIQTVAVAGDRKLEVSLGPSDSPIAFFYFHGVCGDVTAFRSWVGAANTHGSLIAMRGDTTCEARPLRQKWTYDMRRLDHRINKALKAVNELRRKHDAKTPLDPKSIVLIGYSQGAHIAQWLANYRPKTYRRVVMIALAKEPLALRLRGTKRVLLMAGALDARSHIRSGHRKVLRAGLVSRYMELPGARHGEYGAEALRVMSEGLNWVLETPQTKANLPPRSDATRPHEP